jgi:hypothetical protein
MVLGSVFLAYQSRMHCHSLVYKHEMEGSLCVESLVM